MTESAPPIAVMAGLHYAAITDIPWSADAHYLALSSQDGYCTLVEFENDELGSPYSSSGEEKGTADQILISGQEGEEMAVDTNHTAARRTKIERADGKVGLEEESPAKAEEMVVEMDKREDKEEKNASEEASASKKPAKRRITPMAIDL